MDQHQYIDEVLLKIYNGSKQREFRKNMVDVCIYKQVILFFVKSASIVCKTIGEEKMVTMYGN